MQVQRWINAHVLKVLPIHHCSFAFSPKSSIVRCAAQHCGARWLVKLDVSGFFGSISEIQVYRAFRTAGYQPLIAFELARLTTYAPSKSSRYVNPIWQVRGAPKVIVSYNSQNVGFLPQGAPTSPMLSNLIMRDWPAPGLVDIRLS
jgi:RNA-directed DNA polymerase